MNDDIRRAVTDTLGRYAEALDNDDLEAWPDFFLDDGQYRVLSRENVALGLPAPLMYYYSRGMMLDRVRALREALTYPITYCRHILSLPRLAMDAGGGVQASTAFSLYHTTEEGVTQLFTTGRYDDLLEMTQAGPKFRSRTVIMDSFGVKNLIAVPL